MGMLDFKCEDILSGIGSASKLLLTKGASLLQATSTSAVNVTRLRRI